MIGTTLAHYRITEALGAGGMGEVWRAEDTKLGREVAVKVLPAEFAQDADRMARFEREARVLASLNHPNIATLYGLESVSGTETETGTETVFLAMELVDGEDLSERIKRGPIAVEEAMQIALQVAEALEAAHEQGIVHRDLKPANIKLRRDGNVKVLDFGLAKAWEDDGGDPGLSLSPTMTARATAAGVILGTAAYMSPEQARGLPVDRRADIWAFGVVLWEMLTGRKLFEGQTVSDVLASVLKEAPDLEALPAATPVHVRRLVSRCLDKDPKRRLRDIGEARVALDGTNEEPMPIAPAEGGGRTAPWRRRLPWIAFAGAMLASIVLVLFLLLRQKPEQPVVRFEVPPPPGGHFHLAPDDPGPVVVSPDGAMIAFTARDADGVVRLWVRKLDEFDEHPLAGSEDAQYPFWSPDSTKIGFFSNGKLRAVEAVGGPPLTLCEAFEGKGGSWSRKGVILFSPSYNTPLFQVPEVGGEPTQVTELNSERNDNSHRHPRFLADGNHFLYMARSAMGSSEGQFAMIGALDDSVERVLLRAPTNVEYASGHLLYIRGRTLMARPFDAAKLEFTGTAFPIAENVTVLQPGTVVGVYSASQNGVLAYQSGVGGSGNYRLVWRDREGNELATVGEPGSFDEVHILPDGEQAVVAREDLTTGTGDLWLVDLHRDLFTRFTFEPGYEFGVSPTPDGKAVYYSAQREGRYVLVRQEIGGASEGEVVFESDSEMYPSSVSPDESSLCFYKGGDTTGYDIWILPLEGDGEAEPFLQTEFTEALGMFSPDGRWLAYVSDESGSPEIYVTAYPDRGRKWQISTNGGQAMRWDRDGSAIVYHAPDGTLVRVQVEARAGGLLIGEAEPLFNTHTQPSLANYWDISPDGQRILGMESVSQDDERNLNVVLNWLEAAGGN